ncbi:uncharacterized protein Z518_07228 [Rhinocladiella mackenziei CBS 650.93]|uniref:NACHT domain-containing protein n=1 Tax=Rhinocladiella mackenziei CBS 650.93 TaxID=1442369 RepID=A0A0D2J3V7_9EURO|nr:uncharacterized protein Z518_07228 [Rhinocladiella mackenziei CBS 650.93]KIX03675.1 hypothetical protein Z518_07228 [Rhinocladiella mackenziei CBS 650.93]
MRLNSFRHRFQRHSDNTSTQRPRADSHIVSKQTCDVSTEFAATTDGEGHTQTNHSAIRKSHPEQASAHHSTRGNDIGTINVSSDLWSAAYREAIDSFGDDIDVAILMASSTAQLLKELEEIEKDATQESVFLRGVAYLHSIQVPLERFKLALDLASPLSKFDPTATTVVGVVRSVTAIAISFATADLQFAKQIGEMLEQISYIDDCDTLGQRTNRIDIHKALVSVYRKILEFYKVAHEILTRRGAKLVMKMVLETDRLPNIVQDFLRHADSLRKLVEKATWEIVEDIRAMLYDSEISRWLGSDKLSLQSQYHSLLQELRNDDACGFLLKHPAFIGWYQASDSQWLALLGDMGCGKTVTMAFLVDELSRRNEYQIPKPKTCYYYCRDDQAGQANHMFSTLILALLEQLSGLKKTFFEWYKQNQASGIFEPATNPRKLGEFLETVLGTLDRPVFIVIDGLDECNRASRKALFKLLRSLSQKTPRLKIILSSRPEEEILKQLDTVARIDLSSDAHRDALIVRHTVEMQLPYLSEDVKTLTIKELSRLAQGSAIWTKMVVELIEVRRITALGPMRLFLKEMPLPEQLSKLYATVISRYSSDDTENKELVATALKLLAAAWRPLSIQELAWAVALAAARHEITTVAALAQLVDHERVISLIHPFITRLDYSDVRKRQVRLVHQSVKEFIIREWPRLQDPSTALDRTDTHLRIESSEAYILDVCINYLLLDEIGSVHLFSEEQVAINELPQEFDLFEDTESFEYDPYCTWEAWEENMIRYDPNERGFGQFFVYAASHWIKHFGAVQAGVLPQLAKIESLCQAGSIRLDNWINQNCRPDCAMKARFEFDSRLYDPLSITSLYGSEAMLRNMLKNSNFDKNQFLPLSVFNAAHQIFQWGDLSRLQILFSEGKFSDQLRNLDFFRLIVRQWSDYGARHDNWNVAFELVDYALDSLVEKQWGREILCIAARAGCMPMIQHLLGRAQHKPELRTELLRGFQSIGEAILGNHTDVVEYLLEQEGFEAHLRYVNSRGETVLHLASKTCNPAIFRLLVPRLQESVHQTDNQGDTALMWIIKSHFDSKSRYESARILLLSQADAVWDSHFWDERHDPLQMAVRLGDTGMCRLLICDGKMNPHSALIRGKDGQLVLKDRPWKNDEIILQLLRRHASRN